jgi:hypothetical protein
MHSHLDKEGREWPAHWTLYGKELSMLEYEYDVSVVSDSRLEVMAVAKQGREMRAKVFLGLRWCVGQLHRGPSLLGACDRRPGDRLRQGPRRHRQDPGRSRATPPGNFQAADAGAMARTRLNVGGGQGITADQALTTERVHHYLAGPKWFEGGFVRLHPLPRSDRTRDES